MRITLFVIALAFAAASALADPRIIVVGDSTPVSGATSVQETQSAPPPTPPADIPSKPPGGAQPPAPPAPSAQDNPAPVPAAPPPRYSFRRVEDGFLRLDTQTGQVTLCSAHAVGWACQTVPEERAALEEEIERLRDQVEHLRQEIATLRASPPSSPSPPRPPGDLTPKSDQGGGLKMPTDEDIARARAAVENAWRRLMEMMKNLQDDMTRKN
ncbi:MAG TPA: hypothetical protein VGJ01_13600 [Pseudolabrys sp.]